MTCFQDNFAIMELLARERAARDQSRWDALGSCYHPDSSLSISWFQGTGAEFAEASRRLSEKGPLVCHQTSLPFVMLGTNRALAEMGMVVHLRASLQGFQSDVVSFTRLLCRLERREETWRILTLDAIYHKDSLSAAVPGTPIEIDYTQLGRYRSSYRCLSYLLEMSGYPIDQGLPGDDQPHTVSDLRSLAKGWLREEVIAV